MEYTDSTPVELFILLDTFIVSNLFLPFHFYVPYLPVYNARLCIIRTLIFDLFFPKKKDFMTNTKN